MHHAIRQVHANQWRQRQKADDDDDDDEDDDDDDDDDDDMTDLGKWVSTQRQMQYNSVGIKCLDVRDPQSAAVGHSRKGILVQPTCVGGSWQLVNKERPRQAS